MSQTSRSRRPSRTAGFTLVEVLVAMTVLVVVIIMSMAILFTMQRFADRQQLSVEPRQTARRGVDYISYYLRNSGSRVTYGNSGIVAWTSNVAQNASPASVTPLVQRSYDNLTAAQAAAGYGDQGTDIISLVTLSTAADFRITVQDASLSPPATGQGFQVPIIYKKGCPGGTVTDPQNQTAFRNDCQCAELNDPAGTGYPFQIAFFNNVGQVVIGYINASTDTAPSHPGIVSDCGHAAFTVNFNTLLSLYNPPALVPNLFGASANSWYLATPAYASFRVKTINGVPQLQQSPGIFSPAAPNSGFYSLLENVEDLQIAYLFTDGTVWNDADYSTSPPTLHQLPAPTAPTYTMSGFNVAPGVGAPLPPTTSTTDATYGTTKISGIRISLVARSTKPVSRTQITNGKLYYRPAIEDHYNTNASVNWPVDYYYHNRMTATVMIRNMILGN